MGKCVVERFEDAGEQRDGGKAGALGVEGGQGVGAGFAFGGGEEGEEVREGNAEFGGDFGEGERWRREEVRQAGGVQRGRGGGGCGGCGDHVSTDNVRHKYVLSIGFCLVCCKSLGGGVLGVGGGAGRTDRTHGTDGTGVMCGGAGTIAQSSNGLRGTEVGKLCPSALKPRPKRPLFQKI